MLDRVYSLHRSYILHLDIGMSTFDSWVVDRILAENERLQAENKKLRQRVDAMNTSLRELIPLVPLRSEDDPRYDQPYQKKVRRTIERAVCAVFIEE